ncbi:hypothetical protein B0H21DRAFT_817864 [Amylocystis lapponica]|nr:hypothetical protein B0H21DRAFT_817864 [Amylocystis lapponica]
MPSDLPQEVVDQVVDHLWDDIPTLLACSQSCCALFPATRVHLFSTIRLGDSGQYRRFQQLLQTSPYIARLVRKLTVSGSLVDDPDAWVGQIPSLLEQLVMVDELELTKLYWEVLQSRTNSLTRFAALKRLVFSDVSFATPAQIQTLLGAIPNVAELRVQNVTCGPVDTPLTYPILTTLPTSLHHLLLDSGNCHEVIVDSLLSAGCVSDLCTLSVRWADPWKDERQTEYLSDILPACGASLEQLCIELPQLMSPADVWHMGLNLEHNANLRALRVDGLVLPKSCAWAVEILSHICSPHLETIDFSMYVSYFTDIYSMEWARLDSILAKDLFRGVAVTFHVRLQGGCGTASNAAMVLNSFLPELKERGKLTVSSF